VTSAKWMVFDTQGRRHQPPTPEKYTNGLHACPGAAPVHATERLAVLAWALKREIDVAEVVAPFHRSMRERCQRALDCLWELVRVAGVAEGGNGMGITLPVLIDGDGGTDDLEWDADDCDAALDPLRVALTAVALMSDGADPDPEAL